MCFIHDCVSYKYDAQRIQIYEYHRTCLSVNCPPVVTIFNSARYFTPVLNGIQNLLMLRHR